jgi:hypothetical protein
LAPRGSSLVFSLKWTRQIAGSSIRNIQMAGAAGWASTNLSKIHARLAVTMRS